MNSNKTIVITGASGMIGNALCSLLSKHRLPFIALFRSKPLEDNKWNKEYCHLENADSISLNFWGKAGCIIHCAASIPSDSNSPEACYDINKLIDNNIYNIIKRYSVPMMIFISSTSVYAYSEKGINEDSNILPQSIYSMGKLESELMFKSLNNCKTVFLRINAPYHFNQRSQTVLKIFIENSLNNKDLKYHGSGSRAQDFTAVEDIAKAIFQIILLGIKTSGEAYNVSSGRPISMLNLAQLVISLVPDTKSKIIPSGILDIEENSRSIFLTHKIHSVYNWSPEVSLEQGIKNWINSIIK